MAKYAKLVDRISGKGSNAWDIHFKAVQDKEAGKDVIVMSVGDPDFHTPEPIINAAVSALENGDTHYSEITGKPELRRLIAKETMRLCGADRFQLSVDNVMVTAGTQNALFIASLCLLDPEDEALVLDPMYVTYEATWRATGAKMVRVATPRENGFRLDINKLKAAITPKTKAIIFANPNNPTGVVFDKTELQTIADLAIAHDLWVIADEVYAAQTYDKPHYSIAALEDMRERTITCSSLSKSQAMTGWRLGWLVGPKTLIDHCNNLGLAMLYGVAGFIQQAGINALTSSRDEMAKMLDIYRQRRDLVATHLANIPNLELLIPEAGMFVLLDISKTGLDANTFSQKLYESELVSTLDGAAFGEPTASCVRLSFTSGNKELEEGCRRIKRFMASLG